MSKTKTTGPVLLELDDMAQNPGDAPAVPELIDAAPQGQTMQTLAVLAGRKPSALWRVFWTTLFSLVAAAISLSAWDLVMDLLGRNIWLGRAVTVVIAVFVATTLALSFREWAALARLRRVDGLRRESDAAWQSEALKEAQVVTAKLKHFYSHRPDQRWGLQKLGERQPEIMDADGLLMLAEKSLMEPLDAAARVEIETAARQVATITALVPLALADVATALFANLRMVRRIAEIYGGRAGTFGSWRLLRTVLTHLVATGAVSIGDDLIGAIAGGGIAAKLSRRFGEGVINGALTARVGIAAMEVCRPLPFKALPRPGVTSLVKRALTGLFGSNS